MELRHMRHFVTVAEELNFGRAAQRLNMAQPPLSQSIRRLEDDLGVQLFDRSRRGVALTRAGLAFLNEARSALKHAELARKLACREAEPDPEIRVSFATAATYRLVPQLLVKFRDQAPNVNVRLFELPSPAQVEPLLAGDFDVAFVNRKTSGIGDCETLLVEQAALVAAVPADWPLALRTSVSLAELAEHPFILPPKQNHPRDSDTILALFRKAGVMPYVTQDSTHASSAFTLVGAGLGCTMTTATAALTQPRNVRFVPIADGPASPSWGLMMLWHPQQLTQFAQRFVEFAVTYVQETPSLMEFSA